MKFYILEISFIADWGELFYAILSAWETALTYYI